MLDAALPESLALSVADQVECQAGFWRQVGAALPPQLDEEVLPLERDLHDPRPGERPLLGASLEDCDALTSNA